MRIACLGWGSLIWDPRVLQIRSAWFLDGPFLPIEFARESRDKRITLVITPGASLVRSLWAISSFENVNAAARNLAEREDIKAENISRSIGIWSREAPGCEGIDPEIIRWGSQLNLDAIIWTNLKPRIAGKERVPTADEVLVYLRSLPHKLLANAETYVRNAPQQIDTLYRRRIEREFGWKPRN